MLAEPRARAALVDNFFGQWLQTRNVWLLTPDANTKFPWFDDNLRSAMVRETELFLDDQLKADRGIAELLTADSTFLNEQLARHYGIAGVYGSHFRRVTLADENRWGLLGKASVLAVTSYPTRTSPTLRGKWLLENILAAPVPPPPPNTNTNLDESTIGKSTTVREMLEQHRTNPVCASCHARMDPLGFSLENFDAVGQWRTTDGDAAIDATGVLLDGTRVDGPAALRRALLAQKEQFVRTVTGKLLTYAIGRADGVRRCSGDPRDRPSSGRRRLPLVFDDAGDRQEPAVSDEEVAVDDRHEEGACLAADRAARDGHGGGAAAAGCDGPGAHCTGEDAGESRFAASASSTIPTASSTRTGCRKAWAATSCSRGRWRRSSRSAIG